MLKIKNIVALLIFTFALCAAKTVSAQDSCRFAADESLPFVTSAPRPAYPTKAVLEKAEGDVQIDVKIDSTGEVTEATFVSGHELLKKPALDSALKWRFNKTTDETGIRGVRITITFYLNDDNYEEQDSDELKYKYRMRFYRFYIADCFNDCGDTKKQ
jgi:TonB family protein